MLGHAHIAYSTSTLCSWYHEGASSSVFMIDMLGGQYIADGTSIIDWYLDRGFWILFRWSAMLRNLYSTSALDFALHVNIGRHLNGRHHSVVCISHMVLAQ